MTTSSTAQRRGSQPVEPSLVPCYRYPCNTAYHRGKHRPRENGEVLHEATWGHEARETRPGDKHEFPNVWSISAIAWGDGPWMPRIYVENGQRAFSDPKEVARFTENLVSAITSAGQANLDEAMDRAEAAEGLVEHLEAELEPTS